MGELAYRVVFGTVEVLELVRETNKGYKVRPIGSTFEYMSWKIKEYSHPYGEPSLFHTEHVFFNSTVAKKYAAAQIKSMIEYHVGLIAEYNEQLSKVEG